MEKRLLLAVLLMSATVLLTNLIFPPPEPPAPAPEAVTESAPAPRAEPPAPVVQAPREAVSARADTVVVTSPLYRYAFSTRGASVLSVQLLEYPSYTREGPVQLVPNGGRFLSHRLALGGDTVDLDVLPFQPSSGGLTVDESGAGRTLGFSYAQADGFSVQLEYTFAPDGYLLSVAGHVGGISGRPATLLTTVAPGLAPNEAADHHSEQQLAIVTRSPEGLTRVRLSKLQGVQEIEQPLTWAGIKDKYFLAALIAGGERPLSGAVVRDLPDARLRYEGEEDAVVVPHGEIVAAVPIAPDGRFAFQTYIGPQEFERLAAVGHDLENVTQYAYRWLEPVIRPVAAAILWVLELLHTSLGLAYGWVLVLFGVLMRVVLWPLNTKAMRAQMKNMAVQPLMQELREKYKDDPQRQQAELMKLVKEHGFNPLAGCFPLLIPFPVLITLFFVFQNTIAFRGAEFLWLPDLSLRDPLYVLPLFLVVSMFALQWIGARASGMESNPQMKMMLYFMPIMMGVLFFTLPAGLNLYYATTNVASIPQQLLIARERKRAKEEMARAEAPPPRPPAARRGAKRKARGR